MAHADVVGGHRHPATVRLLDFGRQFVPQHRQVARTAHDALMRIQPVLDAQSVCRLVGQHHHAAHSGIRGRGRVPLGFLVGHRGQQAPVEPVAVGGLDERRPKSWKARLDTCEESRDALPVQALDVTVIALGDALEQAAGSRFGQERLDRRSQFVVSVPVQRPRHFGLEIKRQGDLQVGMVAVQHLIGLPVCSRKIEFSVSHPFQQFGFPADACERDAKAGHAPLHGFEFVGGYRTSAHADAESDQIRLVGHTTGVDGADQYVIHDSQRGRPAHGLGIIADQAGGGQMNVAAFDRRECRGRSRHDLEADLDAEPLAERHQQVVFEAFRSAVRAGAIGVRVLSRGNTQLAEGLMIHQTRRRRRLACGQQPRQKHRRGGVADREAAGGWGATTHGGPSMRPGTN